MKQKILITGGAGFIGSHLITLLMQKTQHEVLNLDKLTYAANPLYLKAFEHNPHYKFLKLDICEKVPLELAIKEFRPHKIMHLAAESHVDRSISQSDKFVQTNIIGTYNLLECAQSYYISLNSEERKDFLFHHISTDEVYGDLPHPDDKPECSELFTEKTAYAPSSPYSATKAGSDHLVRAWHRTYGLPTLITNCSNNYGPHQHNEKLIPLTIAKALSGKNIPIYGNGRQIRDWLYVKDHVEALYLVSQKGRPGQTYNIGGNNELKNIEVVKKICSILDELKPKKQSYHELISFVKDRPGHDCRYAIDAKKIKKDLNWEPKESFESGLRKTVEWYLKQTTLAAEVTFVNKHHKQTLDNPKLS